MRDTNFQIFDRQKLNDVEHGNPALLHCLVKGATEYALILLCPEEKITYWNEGAARIFGYKEEEILGAPVFKLFTHEDVELRVAHKELEKARQDGWADDERWHVRKDGTRFWANGVVTCVKDNNGDVIGFSKVLRDQTLRKQTEDKLKSAISELTHFNHMLSHDLQEPLRMVSTYLGLVQKRYSGKLEPEHDEFITMALKGTDRLKALLGDLLKFVRVENSPDKIERTDSAAICDMAISNLKVLIDETGAIVTRTSLPIVKASSTQLAQVFQNLIANGIKYRRKGEPAKIYVDAHPSGEHWLFSVCDNGIGIPDSDRERIFEAFQRLHQKEDYPGTGLGLFICRKILERHGGKIWVEDNKDKPGTMFRFTLPRSLSESEETQAPRG